MSRTPTLKELLQSERILAEVFNNANVGLAVFDRQLRYRLINPYLATSNGTSIESHLGRHVTEILGKVGLQVEPAINKVFATARTVVNCEVIGELPTKPTGGRWIDIFFPIADSTGEVVQVGALVVEIGKETQSPLVSVNASPQSAVLRSWKDIAKYVGTSVKTVQRWEKIYDFPIRRVAPKKGSVVFAFTEEVDRWLREHGQTLRSFRSC